MSIETSELKSILEAALMSADSPLSTTQMKNMFESEQRPSTQKVLETLGALAEDYKNRGVELKEVASGHCFRVNEVHVPWVKRLEKAPRPLKYSRALLETLVIIAYRQPITRAEIEMIRGVPVNTHTIKILTDREWITVAGHRDVPGKPAVFCTTKVFLDYFNLKSLDELPDMATFEEESFEQVELELTPEEQSLEQPAPVLTEEADEQISIELDSETEQAVSEQKSEEEALIH